MPEKLSSFRNNPSELDPGAHAMSLPGVLLEVDQAGEGLEAEVALQVYWH